MIDYYKLLKKYMQHVMFYTGGGDFLPEELYMSNKFDFDEWKILNGISAEIRGAS